MVESTMQIERVYLKGCKPLLTGNIQEVDYRPHSHFQIIIGTNGSGKTTLLREASPLPANHNDFVKGGRKEFVCVKDNKRYTLISDFSNGNEHFFYIDDGKNLNEGKKITAQRQLVAEHFNGYDQDIHDLLVGENHALFTNMSNTERRKWFTRLNTSDMTYALRFYNDLKGKLRDSTGALQHLKKRLTEEQDKFNTLNNIDGLDTVIQQLKKEMVSLLEIKDNHNKLSQQEAFDTLQERLQRVNLITEQLEKTDISFFNQHISSWQVTDIAGLQNFQEMLSNEILVSENSLQLYLKELEGMGRNLDSIQKARQGETDKVLEQKSHLLQMDEDLRKQIKIFKDIPNASSIYHQSINSVIPALKQCIMEFDIQEDDDFSKEGITVIQQTVEKANKYLSDLKMTINTLKLRLKHIQDTHDVNCPQCQFTFKPGIEIEEADQLKEKISKGETRLEEAEKRYQDLLIKFHRAEAFLSTWRTYKTIVSSHLDHDPLWTMINNLDNKAFIKTVVLPILHDWEDDLLLHAHMDANRKERETLEKLLSENTIGQTGELFDEIITQRANDIDQEIQSLQEKLYQLKEKAKTVQACIDIHARIERIKLNCRSVFEDFLQDTHLYLSAVGNDYINQQLISLNAELVTLETKLQEKEKYASTIDLITTDIAILEKKATAYKTLLNEMSPTDGLIAEYLSDNIGRIIDNMNIGLDEAWTYALKILPCGIESGDLDYEFPFVVRDNNQEPIRDIKLGSKGQKEIMNFFFKTTAMLFLGLEGYPLFLDELGESFDYQHRIKILDYIKNLVYNQEFSQIFYISQYASNHDAFTQADVCVTDTNNVIVPAVYNQFMAIK